MAIVFETKFDGSNAVRYFHVSIVNFYLNTALRYAKEAQKAAEDDGLLRQAICAITFSAMTLEAFINERADNEIPSSDKADFDRMRRKYEKPTGQSSMSFKFQTLVRRKYKQEVPTEILAGIEELSSNRNMLVHYQPMDTAGKYIMPPPTRTSYEGVGVMFSTDFTQKPERVEPPFLQKINSVAAAESYNTVLEAMRFWHACINQDCGLDKYPVVTPNHSRQTQRP